MNNIFNRLTNFIKSINRKQFLLSLVAVALILGVGGAYYFYGKYHTIKTDPNLEAQKETKALILAINKLIELPVNETPTIATISDKEKLKNQPFFRIAQNGDKLFVYNTSMTAILYRPSTNKIINVAPITVNQPQNLATGAAQNTSTPASLRIVYYNGTQISGLAGLGEKAVKGKYPTWQTASIANALKNNYKETLVVDLSGTHSPEAGILASFFNGKIGTLPQGEIAPNADILIIFGK